MLSLLEKLQNADPEVKQSLFLFIGLELLSVIFGYWWASSAYGRHVWDGLGDGWIRAVNFIFWAAITGLPSTIFAVLYAQSRKRNQTKFISTCNDLNSKEKKIEELENSVARLKQELQDLDSANDKLDFKVEKAIKREDDLISQANFWMNQSRAYEEKLDRIDTENRELRQKNGEMENIIETLSLTEDSI